MTAGPRHRILGALALAGLSVVAAACGSSAPAAPPPSQGLVLDRPTPQHAALVDQAGRSVSLADLRGKVVVLAPFLSLCQDECPLVTGAFIALQRDLRAAGMAGRVVFVEATVDPGRDTVARLAAYRTEFGADWELWTGSPDQVAAFWHPFGVQFEVVSEGQPRQDRLVDRHATDLRRGAHRRVHPARRPRPRALRRRQRPEHARPPRPQAGRAARRRRHRTSRQPDRAQLDHGRRARPPSAGSSAPTSPPPGRDPHVAPAATRSRPGRRGGRSRLHGPPPDRVRRRRRHHAVGDAHDRQLPDPHPPALAGRSDPGHRGRGHPLRLRPRHAEPQRLSRRPLHRAVAPARAVRPGPRSARVSTPPWSARCAAPTDRPRSPTVATPCTPTTATSAPLS